jgi:hypothetical protein
MASFRLTKMNQVRVYIQDYTALKDSSRRFFEADWDLPRKHVYTYLTDAKGQEAAEEAFHIFNAPEDMLKEWQKFIAKGYSGPSLSVGDLVEVDGKDYLCCSVGWKRREENCLPMP